MNDWSRADVRTINFLIGAALLYEDVRYNLLSRSKRHALLERMEIPVRVYRFLMTIEDAKSVEELAGKLYEKIYVL